MTAGHPARRTARRRQAPRHIELEPGRRGRVDLLLFIFTLGFGAGPATPSRLGRPPEHQSRARARAGQPRTTPGPFPSRRRPAPLSPATFPSHFGARVEVRDLFRHPARLKFA